MTPAFAILLSTLSLAAPMPTSRVELQWSICAEDSDGLWQYARDKKQARVKHGSTTFLDDAQLTLLERSTVLRLRQDHNVENEWRTSLKFNLNPSEFDAIPKDQLRGLECETDLYENRSKVGCSLKHKSRSRNQALSPRQRKMIHARYGIHPSDLIHYGPTKTWRVEFKLKRLKSHEPVFFEILWDHNRRIYPELSVKTQAERAEKVADEIGRFLKKKKIKTCPTDHSRTRRVIESFKII